MSHTETCWRLIHRQADKFTTNELPRLGELSLFLDCCNVSKMLILIHCVYVLNLWHNRPKLANKILCACVMKHLPQQGTSLTSCHQTRNIHSGLQVCGWILRMELMRFPWNPDLLQICCLPKPCLAVLCHAVHKNLQAPREDSTLQYNFYTESDSNYCKNSDELLKL